MTPDPRLRLRRLAPGVYDDGRGGCHVEVSELLAASGYSDTEENRAMLMRAVEIFGQDRGLAVTYVTVDVAGEGFSSAEAIATNVRAKLGLKKDDPQR